MVVEVTSYNSDLYQIIQNANEIMNELKFVNILVLQVGDGLARTINYSDFSRLPPPHIR